VHYGIDADCDNVGAASCLWLTKNIIQCFCGQLSSPLSGGALPIKIGWSAQAAQSAAQIGLDHRRVVQQVGAGIGQDDLAGFDDVAVLGNTQRLADVLFDQEDR